MPKANLGRGTVLGRVTETASLVHPASPSPVVVPQATTANAASNVPENHGARDVDPDLDPDVDPDVAPNALPRGPVSFLAFIAQTSLLARCFFATNLLKKRGSGRRKMPSLERASPTDGIRNAADAVALPKERPLSSMLGRAARAPTLP
jgi:hypothetical protein